MKSILMLVAIGVLSGCGIKGKPLPPLEAPTQVAPTSSPLPTEPIAAPDTAPNKTKKKKKQNGD